MKCDSINCKHKDENGYCKLKNPIIRDDYTCFNYVEKEFKKESDKN